MELFRGYVPTRNKQCLEKFKGVEKLKTRSEVQNLDEYAGILGEETILIDVDDAETSELLFRIVQDLELKCRVYATTRGKHFLFKNCGVKKSWTKCTLAVGITTDGKVGANNSYEILKSGGVERPILYDFPEGEIQELPKWLTPVKSNYDFPNLGEGDGRNQTLFNYILTLQSDDFTKEEARECIRLINRYVLKKPLSDKELDVILRDDAFKKTSFFRDKTFLFDKFATYLKNNNHIVKINNQLHIYKDGIYVSGAGEIEGAMIKLISNLKRAWRSEVLSYLEIMIEENTKATNPNIIAFSNGLYNIRDGSFKEFTPDVVITNKIPWPYNPAAHDDPLLDIALNNVQWRIKNLSNLSEIPEGLESLAVSMAVGEYLNMKKCSGQLEGFDLDAAAVKSIQEGDTNITFALGEGSSTPEQRLNSLIDYLINGRIGEIYRYRRLVW